MTRSAAGLEASYASCRRVARQARSSFYPSFLLLRGPRRKGMEALYAFMRHTDDLGDCPCPADQRRQALAQWRSALEAALAEASGCADFRSLADFGSLGGLAAKCDSASDAGSALLPALVDTVRRFHVPEEHLFAVIDGVEMDVAGRRYRTFAELAEYCHCVGSAVGLACIHLWGFRGAGAFEPARSCGLAFQLTNILRDLRQDAASGRIYLPQEDLDQCRYSAEELGRGVADERFDRLMAIEIRRAREFYGRGAGLFDWLEPPGRRVFGMMLATYSRLLEAIARRPRSVLAGRVHLSRWQKVRIAARWTLLPATRPREVFG
jgi:phytoene synthase